MTRRLSPGMTLMLLVPPLLWAGNAVVGRLLVGHVPPLALNALRWLLAGALLLPMGWRVLQDGALLRTRWRYFALLGLVGVGSYNAFQYLALQTSTPLNITLIAASMPVWMMVVGRLFYGTKVGGRQVLGAVLSLAGVLLVLSRGSWAALAAINLVVGDLLMLLAVLSWSVYSWMLARPPATMRGEARPDWDWAETLLLQVAFGSLWGMAAAGAEQALHAAPIDWRWPTLAGIAYVAIGPSIMAYYCWGKGVAAVGPAVAAFFANLTPVFAAMLSALLLGQAPQWFHVAAFALIVAGIIVTARTGSG